MGTDIRVTAISPGAVQTEFSKVRYSGDEDKAAAVYDGIIPLNAADVADNVFYAATRYEACAVKVHLFSRSWMLNCCAICDASTLPGLSVVHQYLSRVSVHACYACVGRWL